MKRVMIARRRRTASLRLARVCVVASVTMLAGSSAALAWRLTSIHPIINLSTPTKAVFDTSEADFELARDADFTVETSLVSETNVAADVGLDLDDVRAPGASVLGDRQRGQWWFRRAERLAARSQLDEALAACDRASELMPYAVAPCLQGARLGLIADQPDRMLQFADCAVARAPDLPVPHLYRGVAHQLLGQSARAVADYRVFSERAPQHPRSWEADVVALRLMGGERLR